MPKKTFDIKWYGKEIGIDAAKKLKLNSHKVGMFLEGHVIRSISIGQPKMRMPDGELRGTDPSAPGEPPKVVTGLLRSTINYRVEPTPSKVKIFVGAYTKYARDLEYGNKGIHLGERPFLRPVFHKYAKPTSGKGLSKAMEILTKGLFDRKRSWDRRRKV
jgi:hypothetical protein